MLRDENTIALQAQVIRGEMTIQNNSKKLHSSLTCILIMTALFLMNDVRCEIGSRP
jgi:hypothetical protein